MDITRYHEQLAACGIQNIEDLILLDQDDLNALDLTEEDRNKLFDVISVYKLFNIKATQPLRKTESASALPSDEHSLGHSKKQKTRGYRRHSKPDPNAPRLPPSAYVTFAAEYRRNLVEGEINFVDIAKGTGQAWQAMAPDERAEREAKAASLKKDFRTQLELYKTTESYRMYQQYLRHFKEGERSKPPSHSRLAPPSIGGPDYNIDRKLELEQVLLKLSSLASLNDHESSRIRHIALTSLGRHEPTAQFQQSLLPHEHAYGTDSATKAQGYIVKEPGFDEAQALKSLPEQLAEDTQLLQSPHTYLINPFHFHSEEVTTPFLMGFLERVNPILVLFDELTFLHNLEMAHSGEIELATPVLCELCLGLAIGVQWCDHGSNETALLWYENGRRFLDDVDWDHEPWVMRAMTLISIYHLSTRLDTARHYLHVGIRIARAHNFFDSTSNSTVQTRDHEWLLVWNTIMVIDGWLSISPVSTSLIGIERQLNMDNTMQSPSVIEEVPFRYFCDLSTTMRSITRSIAAESLQLKMVTSETTEKYLEQVEKWRAEVPQDLCQLNPNSNQIHSAQAGFLERTSSVNLHMVSMYLGSKMRLSFPSLTKVVDWISATRPLPPSQPTDRIVRVASICIESATDYATFCTNTVQQGFFCPHSWLPIQLIFDAAMIGLIARVWHTRTPRADSLDFPSALDQGSEWKSIIEKSRNVLNHCSLKNHTALSELKHILMLEQFIH